MPTVSVIIPTYNSEKFLRRTVDSVLNQTFQDFELILVDDHSSDRTVSIIRDYQNNNAKIKGVFSDQNHGGPAQPKNIGIQAASGQYIAFLDHDDEWLPNKLAQQVEALNSLPAEFAMVACNIIIKNLETSREKKYDIYSKNSAGTQANLAAGNFIFTTSCILVRKKILEQVGGFDATLKFADDWDLWLRIITHSKLAVANDYLIIYYIHSGNRMQSVNPKLEAAELTQILEKHRELFKKFRAEDRILTRIGSIYCVLGKIALGRSFYRQAINNNFYNYRPYLYLLLSFLGPRLFSKLYYLRKNFNQ